MAAPVSSSGTHSGTIARTRRAILDAAVMVLSRDRSAPMSEIAKAAEVGRSTLHRYFPDRSALVKGLYAQCAEIIERAVRDLDLDQSEVPDAFRRLVAALFEHGRLVDFLFNEPQHTDGAWDDDQWERAHVPMAMLFVRGQREGYFAAEFDADWFIRALWYMLSAGWEANAEGLPRHLALERVVRTLTGGVVAQPERPGPVHD
ncbi:TetR/AcrR family transcriptional regulator [Streptomyces profundus]|uniref:TetR/AcrR family transcriptional regulator n=1 Tax=Streptomyces profundus TaxID=2867410 RepID=UPI001D16F10A|nr:TetR/AcrR family transcriptional regulator [Streptomyces sp. MA3_2.13]UED84418.1 TetR/AcrR family transcriptional regulator [Streptomyces sp. MA3_2.13]